MKNPIPKENPEIYLPFIYNSIKKNKLCRDFPKKEINFLDVILSRRSSTKYSRPKTIEISELLYYSNKIYEISEDESGFLISKRTAPSAGARHPIDILVSLYDSSNIRGLDYYNPVEHSLNKLDINNELLQKFFNEINENIKIGEACIIWFSIQTGKTSSKYENPESLYWRDTGVLLYCIQIIATYLGFNSCPLGTLASNSFHHLFNSKDLIPGGGILIGHDRID